MAALKFVVLFVALLINSCKSDSLIMGTNVNARLVYSDNVRLSAIPFVVRTKDVFYNSNTTIKGIYATDSEDSKATVKVTAGGVGFAFTNILLKSERGDGLNYQIQIYV